MQLFSNSDVTTWIELLALKPRKKKPNCPKRQSNENFCYKKFIISIGLYCLKRRLCQYVGTQPNTNTHVACLRMPKDTYVVKNLK